MSRTDIDSTVASGLSDALVDYSVDLETTEGPMGDKEYEYQNADWSQQLGYYKSIPELKIAVDTKANWVVGNGYEAEPWDTLHLDNFKGNGKDSFNSILINMERTAYIGGDSYSEIIRHENGLILNLKPLDPSSIKIVFNSKGIINRYEQVSKIKGQKNKRFKPENIFHISNKRLADEVHGISIIDSVENIILMRNEAMDDWKRVLHRNVSPMFIFHLDTDDTGEIAAFKSTFDNARKDGENLYVPKNCVVPEHIATATNASLNPLTWIENLNNYFFQAIGVPQIVVGNAKAFTDASAKIAYLAFEQEVKGRQLYVEEQIESQLRISIKLTFPASMQNEAISGQPYEEPMEKAAQPNDMTVEMEGRK